MLLFISIILGAVTTALIGAVYYYNRLVHARMMVQEAWSGVDVQLKRRHDLIPNLVEVVKAYAGHERQTLEHVAALRSKVQAGADMALPERAVLENGIASSLKSILAIAEAYPVLKADNNFLQLHQALVNIEDEIQMSRRYFNGSVRDLNVLVQSFPSNLVAGNFGFQSREFFELTAVIEREAPIITI